MKKFLVALIVVLLGVFVAAKWALSYVSSNDFIVAKVEENLNSRVAIEAVDLNLLSVPTKLEVRGFMMAERDDLVESGMPFSERPALVDPAVSCQSFVCEVSLRELFKNNLKIHRILIDHAEVKFVMREDGTNSLAPLFQPAPGSEAKAQPVPEEPEERAPEVEGEASTAQLITNLDEFRIQSLRFECELEQSGLTIVGDQVDVSIDDIRVDPNDLEKVNQVNAEIASNVKLIGKAGAEDPVLSLLLAGDTTTRLFNPKTGEIDPVVSFDIGLDEQSFLSTHVPTVQNAWKSLKVLERFGLKLGNLPDYVRFGQSRKIKGTYQQGKAQLDDDISLLVSDWELALNAPAWIHAGNSQHDVKAQMYAGKEVTASFLDKVEELVPGASHNGQNLMRMAFEKELVKDGRLTLQLKSHGSLEKPKVQLVTPMPKVEEQVKQEVKKRALDFLRSRFGQ